MDLDKLLEIIAGDDEGIFDVPIVSRPQAMTEDEKLVESFQEINDFFREHGREPENDISNMQEWKLHSRLKSLREDESRVEQLSNYDEFGLLNLKKAADYKVVQSDAELTLHEPDEDYNIPESMDDILADDDFADILGDDEDIFTLKHVPKEIDSPDYVARRKPCKDFDSYIQKFKDCQRDLSEGKRKLLTFANEQQIREGQFFVLRGVLVYLDKVGERQRKNRKVNARLRCIFENGTESDMLLRSLSCELYKDGRKVSEHEGQLMNEPAGLSDDDTQTGYIYVLQSQSKVPEIAGIKDLYKIGFTSGSVEKRISNAAEDPTYLNAPVKIVTTFQCYNLNPQKLEGLLHTFFAKVCLNVDIYDQKGRRFTPREWFVAPVEVIEAAIKLIISGEIVDCGYDAEMKIIKYKE